MKGDIFSYKGEKMSKTVLTMKGIKKSFSGVYALSGIDFSLNLGEVHALLGENGAGKSTLIKVLGGVYQPDEGSILIDGQEAKISNIKDARHYGIGIIHQEIVLVPYLSVAQNIFLGREIVKANKVVDIAEMNRQSAKMLSSLGVNIDETELVGNLTIAQQQMVEIIKAVSFQAKIIVMDEPTSSLSNEEVEQLFEIIAKLKENQVSIIYISHRMEELFRISDRITVIRDGQYVGCKNTRETDSSELVAMMVGRSLSGFYSRDFSEPDKKETCLEIKNLTKKDTFYDISFTLKKGEILGFAGLVGAGRSEIMESIFGATLFDSGEILLNGNKVKFAKPSEAIRRKIAMVPEDRKKQGLVLCAGVRFNLTLASLKKYVTGLVVNRQKCRNVTDKYRHLLKLKAASDEMEVSGLSGGNQQKVVLGNWLATDPEILILDEPTRGVDVNAKFEIYNVMNELVKNGMAIILVSSELPEIINMCDRVCVIREGKLMKILSREEMSQEEIMKYAAGGTA